MQSLTHKYLMEIVISGRPRVNRLMLQPQQGLLVKSLGTQWGGGLGWERRGRDDSPVRQLRPSERQPGLNSWVG